MSEPSEKVTAKEMLDILEHCRVNMALGVVQAYAGKWTERDERTIDAIRRLILAVGEWGTRAKRALGDPDAKILTRLLAEDIRDFDFGKEKP